MSSDFATKIARKLFAQHIRNYEPADPLYETYTDKKGKQRKRKREIPPGLSHRDAKILQAVKKRAHYLDKGFNLGGMRFGWTFVVGIIPGAGDVADVALNYILIVRKARQAEIPDWLFTRMLANNAISAAIGFVPIAGDIMLAVYKANSRNAALLEEFLRIRGADALKAAAAEHEAQLQADDGAVASGRQPARKHGSSWFGWRGKNKEYPAAADSPRAARMSTSSNSRFVEDVPS